MRQLLNTLFVTTPNAYIRLEGETLCVEVDREKKLQVPLHHLGSLVIIGDVMVTPAVLHRCAEEGRSVVWLNRQGQFSARLEGPVSGNILLRQAQHSAARDGAITVNIARACIAGKLRNSRHVLLRGARDTKNKEDADALRQAARLLANHLRELPDASNLDTLRGLEGDSARVYFAALIYLVRSEQRDTFNFQKRTRRPPLDRFNALLSFVYTLLVHDCRAALEEPRHVRPAQPRHASPAFRGGCGLKPACGSRPPGAHAGITRLSGRVWIETCFTPRSPNRTPRITRLSGRVWIETT